MKPIDSFLMEKQSEIKWFASRVVEKWILMLTDLVALSISFSLSACFLFAIRDYSHTIENVEWWNPQNSIRIKCFAILMLITVSVYWAKGHYTKRRPYSNEVREVLTVSALLAVVDAAIVFFGKWQFSRGELMMTWVLAPVLVLGMRTISKLALIRMGGWIRPMVIVGWGENARETALAFEGEKLMGFSLLAFLIPGNGTNMREAVSGNSGSPTPCIALGDKPDLILQRLGNPHVVLALEQGGIDAYQDMIQELGRRSRTIQIVPSLRGLPLYGMEVNHFFAHEVLLLTVRNNLARTFPRITKRIFDILVSLTVLVLASPLLLWIALRVASSGGPIFYGHIRQGQYNKPFPCYKFRTMAPNADVLLRDLLTQSASARAEWERDFKLKDDPRVTPIGKFLRKTSLDELPQLWNVLRGEMSLVGPRPVVSAELSRYGNQVEYYLEAKPGVTGLWQISGRNDVSYDTRVYLDAWYVKNWSLFTDIVILFKTLRVVFRNDGAY